jgi:LysR family hydrogen peroxide-inducible transcriptional activator
MEIHQLRYFVAVAEAGSFSRAAERCFVAQPSMSQQIKKLEANLGQSLFDRLAQGVVLTEAGRALLPRARRILAEVCEAKAALKEDLEKGAGLLNVGAIPTMAPYLLPPVLDRFRREHPNCELSIREDLTQRLVEAVADCELDCAVLSTPIEDPLIELEVLGSERLLVTASRCHPLPPRGRLTLKLLRDEPVIVLHEMHCLGQQIRDFCSAHRVTRRIVCRSTQLETVERLVALDLGISFVPEMAARADGSPERTYGALSGADPRREIAVGWRRDRSRSTLARRFVEMLSADLAGGVHRVAALA